jgi:S1-C subfamily serine protease
MATSAGFLGLVLVGVLASACGGAAPSPEVPKPAVAQPASPAVAAQASLPANSIRRSQVHAVLSAGPGAFLQRVTLDEHAVFQGGKFHGFRLQKLDASFFDGVDLKAGDVVTHINGFPIERPEEALEAFKSLEVSSELRVGYERDSVPRELRYTIVDDEDGPAPAASSPAPVAAPAPAPAAAPAPAPTAKPAK